jgi:hypothetical protein
MPTEKDIEQELIKQACMYLLYDKENETTLRTAFVALAQERHSHFHMKKVDEDSFFEGCKNDICQAAVKILQESRETAVEITPLSTEMLQGYAMRLERTASVCRIYLVKKDLVEEPSIIKPESMKVKV